MPTGLTRGKAVCNVSLTVHAGEVLGLAGLVGAGRTELLRLLCGADRAAHGEIFLGADSRPQYFASPVDAIRSGIGFVPEDRKTQGLLLSQSVGNQRSRSPIPAPSAGMDCCATTPAQAAARQWAQRLHIRAQGVGQPVGEIERRQPAEESCWRAGCTVAARCCCWMNRRAGVDVAARRDMYAEIDRLAASGLCARRRFQ